MLTLSRRSDELIVLELGDGREAVIVVGEIRRGLVRLGVVAPPSVVIYRGELRGRRHVVSDAAPEPRGGAMPDP